MFKVIATSLLLSIALVSGGHAKGVRAESEREQVVSRPVTQAGISLDQAVAMVQSKYRARVNRAVTTERNGRIVHEIRLISSDGSRVWTVHVDAATGQEF